VFLISSTGETYEARPAVPPTPPPGEHLWILVAMWAVEPGEGARYRLDQGNLLGAEGPGCFLCEQAWAPGIGPCTGMVPPTPPPH